MQHVACATCSCKSCKIRLHRLTLHSVLQDLCYAARCLRNLHSQILQNPFALFDISTNMKLSLGVKHVLGCIHALGVKNVLGVNIGLVKVDVDNSFGVVQEALIDVRCKYQCMSVMSLMSSCSFLISVLTLT